MYGIIWRHPDSFELNSIAVTSHASHIRYDWRKRIAKCSEVFWKEKSRSSENGGKSELKSFEMNAWILDERARQS